MDEVITSGQELIESGHNQADKIKDKLEEVTRLWEDLANATEKKSLRLSEASQQQGYNRGIEDLEMHLKEIESQLMEGGFGNDLTSVQNLQKKHALLEANIVSYQDRVDGVKISADQFAQSGHFDRDSIAAKAGLAFAHFFLYQWNCLVP